MEAELISVAEELGHCDDPLEHKRLADRYDHLQHELHTGDAYNLDHKIEGEIFQRESRIEQINEELADQATFREGGRVRAIRQELAEQQSALKKLYEHWEEAGEMNW